jgi:hypothetical protein
MQKIASKYLQAASICKQQVSASSKYLQAASICKQQVSASSKQATPA